MDIPVKTLKSGFSLPVYGIGTYMMGGRLEKDTTNDATEIAAIQAGLDRGLTHIDTAESYGGGHTEELVNKAIQGHDRKKLIITTKVSGENQGYDGVLKACEASLKRIGTDYLDLYLLHYYPAAGLSVAYTMKAMDRLVEEGTVKNIGVCNMTIDRFQEIQKHTQNKLVCNQVEYSLQIRVAEKHGIIKYCQDNDVFITAWGPLRKGILDQAEILKELAKKYNKTEYQVALNWVIVQPNIITIPKTAHVEHLEENLGALGWELDVTDVERLTREFPGQLMKSERVPID